MIWILLSAFVTWSLVFVLVDHKVSLGQSEITENKKVLSSLSVIIVMRNEEQNIVDCLCSIDNQKGLPINTEVIIIDDHSEDESYEKAKSYSPKQFKLNVHRLLEKKGKKNGIRLGLSLITADNIYFTDADCQLESKVISELSGKLIENDCEAVFGPVQFKAESFWQRVLAAENLNNQCVTESFIQYKMPIMANGANMLISRDVAKLYKDSLASETVSGDDVFFAQSLGSQATCVMSPATTVWTNPPNDIHGFTQQRIRWASKSAKYPSLIAILFGGIVFMINLFFLAGILLIPFVNGVFWICLIIGLKSLIEFSYHRRWFSKYSILHRPQTGLTLSILYPIYVVCIGLFSMLGVGYKWKGRYAKR